MWLVSPHNARGEIRWSASDSNTEGRKAVLILQQAQNTEMALHIALCGVPILLLPNLQRNYTRLKPSQGADAHAERMSIRAISRFTGLHETTILSILETAGANCRKLWDAGFTRNLFGPTRCGVLWGCHQCRLPANAPAEWGDQYVWIALDSVNKMVLGFHVGKRDALSAINSSAISVKELMADSSLRRATLLRSCR